MCGSESAQKFHAKELTIAFHSVELSLVSIGRIATHSSAPDCAVHMKPLATTAEECTSGFGAPVTTHLANSSVLTTGAGLLHILLFSMGQLYINYKPLYLKKMCIYIYNNGYLSLHQGSSLMRLKPRQRLSDQCKWSRGYVASTTSSKESLRIIGEPMGFPLVFPFLLFSAFFNARFKVSKLATAVLRKKAHLPHFGT